MLLLYGPLRAVNCVPDQCIILNFTSLCERYESVRIIPPNNLGASSEYEFDVRYMHYIFSENYIFNEFMKIMMPLYYGKNVFLIVSDDDWSQTLNESLLKLIQQRYGINGTKVECLDDLLSAEQVDFDKVYGGLVNMYNDKERFTYLAQRDMMISSGQI